MASSMPSRKAHPCDQCSKSFSSSHQLVQHRRIHTGEKPYICTYCDRAFKQLSHLNQHTRLHTGERPYRCEVCSRAFIQLSNLQQHQKTHSSIDKIVKDSEKRFFCNHCGKGFKGQSSLISHESKKHADALSSMELFLNSNNSHKDSRKLVKFNCQACGKAYSNEGSYRKHVESQHMLEGNGSRASSAESTSASSTAQSLQLWSCNWCASVFTSEFALLAHMEQMRSDPKHQFGAQLILNCAAAEKNNHIINNKLELPVNLNMLSSNLNAPEARSGGSANAASEHSVNISANMLAQNLVRLNQNSPVENPSPLNPPSNERTNENETSSSSHSAEANSYN